MKSSQIGKKKKQHGRAPSNPPRRKHKKAPNDIEEQLRVQRKKRALEDKTQRKEPQQPTTLGNYRYDPERDAYFPVDSFPKGKTCQAARHNTHAKNIQRNHLQCANARQLLDAGATSSQSLRYAMEISPYASRQHDLRSIWAARLLRTGMRVVPTVSSSADGTRLLCMLPSLKMHTIADHWYVSLMEEHCEGFVCSRFFGLGQKAIRP